MTHVKDHFLPGSLHLKTVLKNTKKEKTYEISEIGLPDFLMFRYELHAVLQRPEMMEKSSQNMGFLNTIDEGQEINFSNKAQVQQVSKLKKKDEGASKGGVKRFLPGLTPFSRTQLVKPFNLEPIIDINPKSQKIYVRDMKNDIAIR